MLHLDFETRSQADLRKTGAHAYAEHLSTEVWVLSYAFENGGEIESRGRWFPGQPFSAEVANHVAGGGVVGAHNVMFEWCIWTHVLPRHLGRDVLPPLNLWQLDCTMARAAAVARPMSLAGLGEALGLPVQKDREGAALMLKMSKPRSVKGGVVTWWDDEANIERLARYCDTDVDTEIAAGRMLPKLSPSEHEHWQRDLRMQVRGVFVDVPFAERCTRLTDLAKVALDQEMAAITDGEVTRATQAARLMQFLNRRLPPAAGPQLVSMNRGTLEPVKRAFTGQNDAVALRALKIREARAKTSTAKYAAIRHCAGGDGRVRGAVIYHGATTGRNVGRLFQPQNLPRVNHAAEGAVLMSLIDLVRSKRLSDNELFDGLTVIHGTDNIMPTLSRALRPTLCAPEDRILFGGDFANIEGRVNAWLAGEDWKTEAFREYDAGTGADLYKLAYSRAFGVPVSAVTDEQRQIGKVQELALGYQGGTGAFVAMSKTYRLDLARLVDPIRSQARQEAVTVTDNGRDIETDLWHMHERMYVKARDRNDLPIEQWCAAKIIVRKWRAANSAVKSLWGSLNRAAVQAIQSPYTLVHGNPSRSVGYYFDGTDLWCSLPSGRLLCYPGAQLYPTDFVFIDDNGDEIEMRGVQVRYMGQEPTTKRWCMQHAYGGFWCENVVQATARDIMVEAAARLEDAGFEPVLTVHDEIVCEAHVSEHRTPEDYAAIMSQPVPWSGGLPIAAKAWTDRRYIK